MEAAPSVLVAAGGDGVAIVTLNRPQRRNGVTVELCERFTRTLRDVAASDARVVVLRGAGDDFCVGADLGGGADAAMPGPGEPLEPLAIYHTATLLHTMPQVTIAAIDGGCAGAGMGWATACDVRVATARSRWSTAFLNVGVSGDMGLAWGLHQIVGGAKARELLLFPDRFGGEEAHRLGLASRLFAPDELHAATLALAADLAARDPLALRLMKANCVSAETLPIADYITVESERHLQTTQRPELAHLMAKGHARRRS